MADPGRRPAAEGSRFKKKPLYVENSPGMTRYLPLVIVAAVGLLTATGGAMLYRAKRQSTLAISHNQSLPGEEGPDSAHILGPAKAPVTLEEFGDYECPPCGKLAEPISELEREFSPNLRVVFRNFPLAIHPHSREAALAAEAAGMQGKFWQMHDLLFRQQPIWSQATDVRELFEAYAGLLGLDVQRFRKDMAGKKAETRVVADQAKGSSLGVKNTPTIFLNNREIDPKLLNASALRAQVESALKAKQPSS
jgi:protein-disulfide isomerase